MGDSVGNIVKKSKWTQVLMEPSDQIFEKRSDARLDTTHSIRDLVEDSVEGSMKDSVEGSVKDSVKHSVKHSVASRRDASSEYSVKSQNILVSIPSKNTEVPYVFASSRYLTSTYLAHKMRSLKLLKSMIHAGFTGVHLHAPTVAVYNVASQPHGVVFDDEVFKPTYQTSEGYDVDPKHVILARVSSLVTFCFNPCGMAPFKMPTIIYPITLDHAAVQELPGLPEIVDAEYSSLIQRPPVPQNMIQLPNLHIDIERFNHAYETTLGLTKVTTALRFYATLCEPVCNIDTFVAYFDKYLNFLAIWPLENYPRADIWINSLILYDPKSAAYDKAQLDSILVDIPRKATVHDEDDVYICPSSLLASLGEDIEPCKFSNLQGESCVAELPSGSSVDKQYEDESVGVHCKPSPLKRKHARAAKSKDLPRSSFKKSRH
ncbi:hypothetical protein MMC11_008453 [Xylographa trunciseda]|nr:hypothetical protein [Xylographa trunciseda]